MTDKAEALLGRIQEHLGSRATPVPSRCGAATVEIAPRDLLDVCQALRDDEAFLFDTLIDVCGVDYLDYGQDEWKTESATGTGFSRSARRAGTSEAPTGPRRFAVVYHLLSVARNERLRLRAYCDAGEPPLMPSVVEVWPAANWFEREAFDLFGILFDGHPDLRRLLTDYGFIGHPFRKDFPLIGNVEVRYDETLGRVVYEPVSIEPRTLVARVIRHDNRYDEALRGEREHG